MEFSIELHFLFCYGRWKESGPASKPNQCMNVLAVMHAASLLALGLHHMSSSHFPSHPSSLHLCLICSCCTYQNQKSHDLDTTCAQLVRHFSKLNFALCLEFITPSSLVVSILHTILQEGEGQTLEFSLEGANWRWTSHPEDHTSRRQAPRQKKNYFILLIFTMVTFINYSIIYLPWTFSYLFLLALYFPLVWFFRGRVHGSHLLPI